MRDYIIDKKGNAVIVEKDSFHEDKPAKKKGCLHYLISAIIRIIDFLFLCIFVCAAFCEWTGLIDILPNWP